jgi:PST family polysaccharide transporter
MRPLGAVVMREPKVTPVLRVLSVGFAFEGAAVVAGALLRRRLDFKRQFSIESTSYVIGYGVVALTLAWHGAGVWSLVWGGLVQMLVASASQVAAVPSDASIDCAPRARGLLRYGLGTHLSGFVNYLARNGDNFVVGRWIGAAVGLSRSGLWVDGASVYVRRGGVSSVLFPAC